MSNALEVINKNVSKYIEAEKSKEDSLESIVGHVKSMDFRNVAGFNSTVRFNSSNLISQIPKGLSFVGEIDGTRFSILTDPRSENHEPNFPKDIVVGIIEEKHPQAKEAFEIMFEATRLASVMNVQERDFKEFPSASIESYKKGIVDFKNAEFSQHQNLRMIRLARGSVVKAFNDNPNVKNANISVDDDLTLRFKGENISSPFGGAQEYSVVSPEMSSMFGMSLVDHCSIRTFVRSMISQEYDELSNMVKEISKTDVIKDTLEDIRDFNNQMKVYPQDLSIG